MWHAFRVAWVFFMEAYACSRVRHHRIELTTWIVQRDRYRQQIAAFGKTAHDEIQARGEAHPDGVARG